jgi:hypothetical protein
MWNLDRRSATIDADPAERHRLLPARVAVAHGLSGAAPFTAEAKRNSPSRATAARYIAIDLYLPAE